MALAGITMKRTALFSVILLVVGVIVFYVIYTSTINLFKEQLNEQLREGSFHAIDKIDRTFYERYLDMKAFASDPVISSRNSAPEQITRRLKALQSHYPYYASLAVYDRNKIKIAGTSPVGIGKEHPLTSYMTGIDEGKDFVMGVSESKSVNDVAFYFASPLKDSSGAVSGVVSARMPLEKLQDVAKRAAGIRGNGKSLNMDLVDKDGLILYSNYNKKGILKETFPDWEEVKGSLAKENSRKSGIVYREGVRDEIHAFAHEQGYMDFAGNDWTLIMHVPAKEAFAPTLEFRIILLTIGGVALVIFSFFYIIVTHDKHG